MSSSEYKQLERQFPHFWSIHYNEEKSDESTLENESSDDSLSLYFVSSYKTEIKLDILFVSLSCNSLGSSKRVQ